MGCPCPGFFSREGEIQDSMLKFKNSVYPGKKAAYRPAARLTPPPPPPNIAERCTCEHQPRAARLAPPLPPLLLRARQQRCTNDCLAAPGSGPRHPRQENQGHAARPAGLTGSRRSLYTLGLTGPIPASGAARSLTAAAGEGARHGQTA